MYIFLCYWDNTDLKNHVFFSSFHLSSSTEVSTMDEGGYMIAWAYAIGFVDGRVILDWFSPSEAQDKKYVRDAVNRRYHVVSQRLPISEHPFPFLLRKVM